MRLLNSSTLELEEFADDQIPEYAILSHTWGAQEVLFSDRRRGDAQGKEGFKKIKYSCGQALRDGLPYVWIDTCCIDKSSSAELSEAINSMYRWYRKAKRCYAYLVDVPADVDVYSEESAFEKSRWFKRGWTLQELIAPSDVTFFSEDWSDIGSKTTLDEAISNITGIDTGVLTGLTDLESISIAKKMSWASRRQTTRMEDTAYCLMGLFNVNMPMLYGEGEKSFIRLQEEIMKNSDDQSLFAWRNREASKSSYRGLLAESPADFTDSGSVIPYVDWAHRTPFYTTNRGLRITLSLIPCQYKNIYIAVLNCPVPPTYEGFIGIYLQRISTTSDQYARVYPGDLARIYALGNLQTIYVRQQAHATLNGTKSSLLCQFLLPRGLGRIKSYELVRTIIAPSSALSPLEPSSGGQTCVGTALTFQMPDKGSRLVGALVFKHSDETILIIMLGSTSALSAGFDVAYWPEASSFEQLESQFTPTSAGDHIDLTKDKVCVDVESRMRAGVNEYVVDIRIWDLREPTG